MSTLTASPSDHLSDTPARRLTIAELRASIGGCNTLDTPQVSSSVVTSPGSGSGEQLKLQRRSRFRLSPPMTNDWASIVYRWMLRWGMQQCYYRHKGGDGLWSLEELAELLEDELYTRQGDWVFSNVRKARKGITTEQASRFARNAAEFIHSEFDPTFHVRVREHASALGKLGGRPRAFELEELAGLDGLSHAEAAARLGVSRDTIKRRRAELRRIS